MLHNQIQVKPFYKAFAGFKWLIPLSHGISDTERVQPLQNYFSTQVEGIILNTPLSFDLALSPSTVQKEVRRILWEHGQ